MEIDNMDKVLHGLNSCGFCDGIPNICGVTECPYESDAPWCTHYLAHDAGLLISELIKSQEPKEPEIEALNEIDRIYRCPTCHKSFFYEKQKYCDQCGQAIKWYSENAAEH